jgi:hypothetical protein
VNKTAQLAGFLAAHAILEVAKGKSPVPLVVFESPSGLSHIIQIHEATPEMAAKKGDNLLRKNVHRAERGVMAFDAYLNLPQGRSDAIFLQARQLVPQVRELLFAVPYRHLTKPGGFAVHRPKLIAFDDEPLPEPELVAAFYQGVDRHETGGKFWKEHFLDSY